MTYVYWPALKCHRYQSYSIILSQSISAAKVAGDNRHVGKFATPSERRFEMDLYPMWATKDKITLNTHRWEYIHLLETRFIGVINLYSSKEISRYPIFHFPMQLRLVDGERVSIAGIELWVCRYCRFTCALCVSIWLARIRFVAGAAQPRARFALQLIMRFRGFTTELKGRYMVAKHHSTNVLSFVGRGLALPFDRGSVSSPPERSQGRESSGLVKILTLNAIWYYLSVSFVGRQSIHDHESPQLPM